MPFVDREFRTLASREHRACFGKSSGGYGAMIHGMKYAEHWGAVANHSGDSYFEFVYGADWPNTLNELAKHRQPPRRAGEQATVARVAPTRTCARARRRPRATVPREVWKRQAHARRVARDYERAWPQRRSGSGPARFRLPFHLDTGEMIANQWRRWLKHDPVRLVRAPARNTVAEASLSTVAGATGTGLLRHAAAVAASVGGRYPPSLRGIR
jgi:hypothetical protein